MLRLTPIAYCLMPNHYHYLIRQDGDQPAGLLPQRAFNGYVEAYNKRYGHSGTLFESNYRVVAVSRDSYLQHLCRYIHANPVTHGLVANVADWLYSNYREWTGERDGSLVDREFVRAWFPVAGSYERFVADYLVEGELPKELETYLRAWEG